MNEFHLKTLNDVLAMVTSRGTTPVMLAQPTADAPETWQPISSDVLYGRVRALADILRDWGVAKGDRVVILSENRWEWSVTDLAALALGAIDVPLYPTLTAEELGYALRNSGAKVAVLSTQKQYDKLAGAGDLPDLERVVIMDEGNFGNAESFARLMDSAAAKQARDEAFDAMVKSAQPDDIATIIYTSGTTGEPKGAELTHGNLAANLNVSTEPYGLSAKDSSISYLPLSHVVARHLDYAMMAHGARIAYCPVFNDVAKALKATKPTVFVGVPRVYEKIRQGVEQKSGASKLGSKVFAWALDTGDAHKDEVLAGKHPGGVGWALANMLVFDKIRAAFGGCVRIFIAGGAALGTETAEWYARVGIRIFEGYGLTETSPVIARNSPAAHKMGSVGKLVENIEARIAHDGEIEVKGPSIFKHYWAKDKETAEAFTEDGWFKTGDIGKLEDGFLTITDRKKELLKTSGGKLIAPQPLESKLKNNELVGQACMVGDKHKFACVLISPDFGALEKWASGKGVSTKDHAALVADKQVVAEYERIVGEVNKDLPPYETMKRTAVVPDEWSLEGGEMTPSMKLKRRVILEKYAKQIEELYADEASAKGD